MTRQTTMPFSDCRADARPTRTQAKSDRERVLTFLVQRGAIGATDHEIAEGLHLLLDTARARRTELRDAGLVIDSGRRRPSPSGHAATVWVVSTASTNAAARPTRPATPAPTPRHFARNGSEPVATRPAPGPDSEICPRCGSAETIDVAIHNGKSIRRDCAGCGLFVAFVVWYGQPSNPPGATRPKTTAGPS